MPSRARLAAVPALAASTWGFLFALVHLYWLLGGRAGLPPELSLFGEGQRVLLVIDVIAIPLCLGAGLLAAVLALPGRRRPIPRRLALAGAWGVGAVCVVHAAPSAVDWARLPGGHHVPLSTMERFGIFLYEPWFLVGGVLFCLAAWAFGRVTPRVPEEA
ncbi:DUF3995 domain-containing protein [Streptoalloteichus hindustanus]|uniref:DUF3995 domain-containing protein n=1 Tax=Streptoalloteichus hindustanus TaxID=2017 RepID=A0A1M5GGS2_STRHI|nr:DUF3995 domain-containing protein [Streptoalloteichus hindustanus]SHG02924.1 Protein of unknown function [Streptoalloteichus hindustanus]